ncbi:MAG: galactitol-1-phosphate 5-dehydrogenase, partial [Verrucomicrobiaceae bacterium]
TALVVGAGLIGLLVIQALKRAGAKKIIAVDLDEGRLKLAMELGADEAILSGSAAIPEVDVAMEVVGAAPTVDLAIRSVRKGGRVVLVGNLSPTVPLPLQIVVTRELDVVGTCTIAGEYPEALEAIASGDIRVKPLISASVVLEDGVSAFEKAKAPGALKVLVVDEAIGMENS